MSAHTEPEHAVSLAAEEVSFVLNVLHVDGHGHKSSRDDFEPECPSCTAAAKLESIAPTPTETEGAKSNG